MNEWSKQQTSLIKSSALNSVPKIKLASTTGLSATSIPAVTGGVIVGLAGIGLYGFTNSIRYLKKKKTGKQAVKDTFNHATGLGISATLGAVAANTVAPLALTISSPLAVPLITGVSVTYFVKRIWNHHFFPEKNDLIKDNKPKAKGA